MITSCATQLRYATFSITGVGTVTQPVGLDYGVVFAMADALGADRQLLAQALPGVESAMLSGLTQGSDEPEDEEVTDG